MKLGLIISFLLYFVMLMGNRGCNGCLEKERIGLLKIKQYILSLKGDYHKALGSWVDDRDSNCCVWKRVKCSSGHITELSIQSLLYKTPDPNMLNASLFRPFEELRLLDLSYNNFQGWIGNEGFPRLKRLETLDLLGNYLNSSILPSLNGLTALTTLKFGSEYSMENFSAQGFMRSKELEVLDLSENRLNCNIISSLHVFTSLRSLLLSDNQLNCSFSTLDFSKFSRLELLDLSGNQLTGSLYVEGPKIYPTV